MELKEWNLIRGYLPEGRTKYYYFKDRYAFQLLAWKLGNRSVRVGELKKYPRLRGFLQLPRFQQFLRSLPDGIITAERLLNFSYDSHLLHRFRLTVGKWGDSGRFHDPWFQTSRPGWNLVLQLNFPSKHDRFYRSLSAESDNPFDLGYCGHPVRLGPDYLTMCWARIDIDMLRSIAVIEEIQNDWLRAARRRLLYLHKRLANGSLTVNDTWCKVPVRKALYYYDHYVSPMLILWDEAMLSATLSFLYEELEVSMVYLHTWESGLWFKQLKAHNGPPRSVYTRLPARFGFHRVLEGPSFIVNRPARDRRSRYRLSRSGHYHWWRIILSRLE